MNEIAPAQTEWISPAVFEPKKDGNVSFFVDKEKLNAVPIRSS